MDPDDELDPHDPETPGVDSDWRWEQRWDN